MVNGVIDKIRVHTDKVLPLISAICDKIGLAGIVDKQTGNTQNERIVSTGNAIKAINTTFRSKVSMQIQHPKVYTVNMHPRTNHTRIL